MPPPEACHTPVTAVTRRRPRCPGPASSPGASTGRQDGRHWASPRSPSARTTPRAAARTTPASASCGKYSTASRRTRFLTSGSVSRARETCRPARAISSASSPSRRQFRRTWCATWFSASSPCGASLSTRACRCSASWTNTTTRPAASEMPAPPTSPGFPNPMPSACPFATSSTWRRSPMATSPRFGPSWNATTCRFPKRNP